MHNMAFAHVFGPEKKNGFGPFSYKFFVCIRVGLRAVLHALFRFVSVSSLTKTLFYRDNVFKLLFFSGEVYGGCDELCSQHSRSAIYPEPEQREYFSCMPA